MAIGGVLIFLGFVSIPFAYKFALVLGFELYSTVMVAMVPAVLMGGGFFLISVTNMLHSVDVANTKEASVMTGQKRIVMVIKDSGIELTTEGMNPQEIITILELTKYNVITKFIRTGPLIDVVKRE